MGQEWLGPSYFFISLVLGPLNSLLEESTDPNRYTAKAKFCFCKNNKRMIIKPIVPCMAACAATRERATRCASPARR